jgi:hypothetical protein
VFHRQFHNRTERKRRTLHTCRPHGSAELADQQISLPVATAAIVVGESCCSGLAESRRLAFLGPATAGNTGRSCWSTDRRQAKGAGSREARPMVTNCCGSAWRWCQGRYRGPRPNLQLGLHMPGITPRFVSTKGAGAMTAAGESHHRACSQDCAARVSWSHCMHACMHDRVCVCVC